MIKLINNEDYRLFPLRAGKLLAHNEAYSNHLHRAQELGLVDITRQYIKPDRGAPKTKNFY